MSIKITQDGSLITPNTIFLIPPRKNMTIYHGKLFLNDQEHEKGLHLPIDMFFRSLAREKGKDAIGIVLSGTGSDGTLGTRAIKEAGGMIMAQDEKSSKFDGMPRSSIATGLTDFVLPPAQMPRALLDYLQHPFTEKSKSIENILEQDTDVLSKILMILRDFSGVDFSFYKEKTITRRLERRLSVNHFQSLDDYVKLLSDSEQEKEILYRELLIGVTSFFRNPEAFDQFQQKVLPQVENLHKNESLRLWIPGCSTGEEVYSLAIIILEYIAQNDLQADIKIFATDIDREAIDKASQGFYPDSIVADIAPELLVKYFDRKENGYQVNERLRKNIIFAAHNVLKDPPFSRIDVISCRNLFIYLKPEIQRRIFSIFYFALNSRGFLFLGSSESLGDMSVAYETIDNKWKIFRTKEGYQPPIGREMPVMKEMKPKENHPGIQANPTSPAKSPRIDKMLEMVIKNMVSPSIITDEQYNILHVINNVNKFLSLPSGKFTQNLLSLLQEDLQLIVSGLLRKLKSESGNYVYETVKNAEGFEDKIITIEARHLNKSGSDFMFMVITFIENQYPESDTEKASPNHIIDAGQKESDSYYELEKELQYTKENLQATVEELETSNEELQSSNEELIASNEELQSTNEELQSVNEELYTVNSEYQNKIEELTSLNNDMNNLLRNTNIGTLYLDSKLQIRKFTPMVSEITNIMDMDIGRPVEHISVPPNYTHFIEDIKKVLDDLQPVEQEIQSPDGTWYLVKIMPYRTAENAIDGVIVTFVDITKLKEERLRANTAVQRLKQAMDTGGMAWWEWEIPTGNVIYDDKKATMLGYSPDEFPNQIYEITDLLHPDDYEATMQAMRKHLKGETDHYEVSYRIKQKNGGYGWFFDKGGIVEWNEKGQPRKLTGIVVDIKNLQEARQKSDDYYQLILRILENSPVAKIMTDVDGNLIYTNQKARKLLCTSNQAGEKSDGNIYDWPMMNEKGESLTPDKTPFSIIKKTGKPITNLKHYIKCKTDAAKPININGTPVFNQEDAFDGAIFAFTESNTKENL